METAAELLRARGYARTTIEEIAERAGVAVQTIYNAIGGKPAVLDAVLDVVAAGPDAPRRVAEFMSERTRLVRTADEAASLLGEWFAGVHPRTVWLMRVIRDAAAVDASVASLEERRAAQRFANYRHGAELIEERVGLAAGTTEDLAATIWSCGHPDTFHQLVERQGWSVADYREWVVRSIRRHLA